MAALGGGYTREKADGVKGTVFDRVALGQRGLKYERLDQLLFDLLMGVR
jgi:xylose isomerase